MERPLHHETSENRSDHAGAGRYRPVMDRCGRVREIVVAADRFADALDDLGTLDALDPPGWERTGVYTWPTVETRSLAWVGRHTLHELRHHAADIDRSLGHGG